MSESNPKKPAGKPAKPAKASAKKDPGKPDPDKKGQTPSWWVFTKTSASFVESASKLSEVLKRTFGESVTISHFERMLSEFPQLSPDQQKLIKLDRDTMSLYNHYLGAKEARDAERQSFRVRKDVEAVGSALEKVQAYLDGPPEKKGD